MELIEVLTIGNTMTNVALVGLFFYALYKVNKIDFLTDPEQLVPKIMAAKIPIFAGMPPGMGGAGEPPKGKNPIAG